MKGLKIDTQGTKLLIEVDTAEEFGPSKSGKTIIIASTEGNKKILVGDKEVSIGLNVYRAR